MQHSTHFHRIVSDIKQDAIQSQQVLTLHHSSCALPESTLEIWDGCTVQLVLNEKHR